MGIRVRTTDNNPLYQKYPTDVIDQSTGKFKERPKKTSEENPYAKIDAFDEQTRVPITETDVRPSIDPSKDVECVGPVERLYETLNPRVLDNRWLKLDKNDSWRFPVSFTIREDNLDIYKFNRDTSWDSRQSRAIQARKHKRCYIWLAEGKKEHLKTRLNPVTHVRVQVR